MNTITIGASATAVDLEALAERIATAVGHALDDGADLVADEAVRRAGAISGRLAASVAAEPGGIVVAGAPHALFVEMGTARMAARPFLAPALDARRAAILRIVVDAIDGAAR